MNVIAKFQKRLGLVLIALLSLLSILAGGVFLGENQDKKPDIVQEKIKRHIFI